MPGTEHLRRWLSSILHIFPPVLQGEEELEAQGRKGVTAWKEMQAGFRPRTA